MPGSVVGSNDLEQTAKVDTQQSSEMDAVPEV